MKLLIFKKKTGFLSCWGNSACIKKRRPFLIVFFYFSDLGEIRTLDPLIKSQLLYQLSYEVIFWRRNVTCFF